MKKPSVVSFLITLLLAAAVCTHGNEFVTDTDGNPVEVGGQYIIQPQHSVGHGLFNDYQGYLLPCRIIETYEPNNLGWPVVFEFPYQTMERFIPLASDVNIKFKFPDHFITDCDRFWKVNDSSSAIVLVGRPSPNDISGSFRIEKAGEEAGANTYKFTTYIGPVGTKRVSDAIGAAQQLVVTNDPSKTLLVKFSKVQDATMATTSTTRVEKLGLRMFPFY